MSVYVWVLWVGFIVLFFFFFFFCLCFFFFFFFFCLGDKTVVEAFFDMIIKGIDHICDVI